MADETIEERAEREMQERFGRIVPGNARAALEWKAVRLHVLRFLAEAKATRPTPETP